MIMMGSDAEQSTFTDEVNPHVPVRRHHDWPIVSIAVMAGVMILISLAALANAPRASLNFYDEGVYYYQAVLMSEGLQPYQDYFVPQPPGILLMGLISHRCGMDLVGVRLMTWLLGMIVLYQTFWIARLIACRCRSENSTFVGMTAAALMMLSNRFVYVLTQAATDMPALCLVLLSMQILLKRECQRLLLPGLILGCATVFRLQAMSLLPGFCLLIMMHHGWRRGRRPVIWFSIGAMASFSFIHGAMMIMIPKYLDCAFLFQIQRTRVGVSQKVLFFLQFLGEPHVGLSFLIAAIMSTCRVIPARAIAVLAIVILLLTTFSGNVLYLIYYVPALPFLMTAAALGIDAIVKAFAGGAQGFLIAVVAAALGTGFSIKSEFSEQRRLHPMHRDLIETIRMANGQLVLTDDGRVAVLANKHLVADYYSTDPNALFELSPDRFREWLKGIIPRAEIIVVTPKLLSWLTPVEAKLILESGQIVIYESTPIERQFLNIAGASMAK
jgi:hypothetical protein